MDNHIHHTANIAALTPVFVSWLAHAPTVVTVASGFLAAIYYVLLIRKELAAWRNKP